MNTLKMHVVSKGAAAPPKRLVHATALFAAIILGLCAVSLIFVIDTMFNAMINQVFFMLCGALVSIGAGLGVGR